MSTNAIPGVSGSRPLNTSAILLVLLLCLSWGFNQIAFKLALRELPPFLQGTLRSIGALAIILLIARFRGVSLFQRDGTLKSGLILGCLFGFEFVLIFYGLTLTSASRAVVFLYTSPFFVSLGAYRFLGERMSRLQWIGQALSFTGVAFAIGLPQPNVDASVLLGDVMVVGGAALWAATTLIVKATSLRLVPPEKGLGYQTAVSIVVLGLAAVFAGEKVAEMPGALTLGLLAYQAFWVAGLTFLLWFMLIKTYSASKLSAFTFITPLIGVLAGYLIMGDELTPVFGLAALLVTAGLYLVNRPVTAD